MGAKKNNKVNTHVVDILGNVKGRDQPIMLMEKAHELVSTLPRELFLDDDVVFFDPFCKAGEILLACAFNSCIHKSKSGILHDVETIQRELYHSKKYYGLAPDERHHRLSLRTFLGNENSHNEEFNHIIKNGNYLSEEDGKLDEEKYQREFDQMIDYIKKQTGKKKIIAIGNPPYQESDGGFGKSARAIYHHFVNVLQENKDVEEFVLVIPSRWFGGGKGLSDFRQNIINGKGLKTLTNFPNARDVFPTVDINGGVCFLHINKSYVGETRFVDNKYEIEISLKDYDIIPDDPRAFEILAKIQKKWQGRYVGDVAWTSKPFGLRTNYFEKKGECNGKNSVKCLSRRRIIKNAKLNDVSKNKEYIGKWKVCVAAVAGGSKGRRRSTVPKNQMFLVEPDVITTETYNVIQTYKNKSQAERFLKYLQTDFVRYLVGLRKITQHVPPDRWNWVPFFEDYKIIDLDKLYNFFEIDKEQQLHIENKLKEWS